MSIGRAMPDTKSETGQETAFTIYSGTEQQFAATAAQPDPSERGTQLTGGSGSHGQGSQTSFSCQQAAGTRQIQGGVYDGWSSDGE